MSFYLRRITVYNVKKNPVELFLYTDLRLTFRSTTKSILFRHQVGLFDPFWQGGELEVEYSAVHHRAAPFVRWQTGRTPRRGLSASESNLAGCPAHGIPPSFGTPRAAWC